MTIKQDVRTITGTAVSLPLSAAATTLKLAADGMGMAERMVTATPTVIKALLIVPFAAAKGYIMKSEGVEEEEAQARAYKYVNQPLSVTIEQVGVGSGKLLADLLKEEAE